MYQYIQYKDSIVQYAFPGCTMYCTMQCHQGMVEAFLSYSCIVPTVCVISGILIIDTVVVHTVHVNQNYTSTK